MNKDDDILKYITEHSIVDLEQVRVAIEVRKNQELLSMHPYKIYEGKDNKWYTYLPDEKKGRIFKKKNTRKEIEQIVIDYWKQQTENPTIQEVFNEWNDRRLELSKISEPTHLRNAQLFNRHYGEIAHYKIKSVSPEFLEDFLERQVSKFNMTAKSFSNLKTITRGFFKRAKKRKLLDFNIEDLFSGMDFSDREFRKVIKEDYEEVFNEEETDKIMAHLLQNLDLRNLGILLMFVTGIRVGELVGLKHEDFDCNSVKIRRTATRYYDKDTKKYVYDVKDFPKTEAGLRTVVIPADFEWIVKRLRLYNPFGEYIFFEKNKLLTTNCFRTRLKYLCKKLNIHPKSPHKIRKTYGTILLDNNIDERLITGQMGHTNILCTEQHYHRNRKNIARKSEILSSIPDFQAK